MVYYLVRTFLLHQTFGKLWLVAALEFTWNVGVAKGFLMRAVFLGLWSVLFSLSLSLWFVLVLSTGHRAQGLTQAGQVEYH